MSGILGAIHRFLFRPRWRLTLRLGARALTDKEIREIEIRNRMRL